MKKTYKWSAMACVIGLFLLGISLIIAGGKFSKYNSKNVLALDKKQYVASSKIKEIEVFETSDNVEIVSGNVKAVTVDYYESSEKTFTIEEKGNTLVVKRDEKNEIFSFGIDFNDYRVTITLPKDFNGDVNVQSTSGNINVSDVSIQNLTACHTSGSTNFTNINVDDEIYTSSTSGSIKYDNVTAGTISIQSTSGSIGLDNIETESEVNLLATSGSIRFDNLKLSGDLSVITTSGSIHGTINAKESDFTITTSTTSGSSNLTSSSGGKQNLTAMATSGSINISFKK